ncbi:MAG: protein-disulfide reductase DsbD family protein [Myxococcota bacterium]|nr:protein-disulfide reductase DsbD family protein [Myxococcota bacterium]
MRKLVVRFELAEGLHIYADPVPDGMVGTKIGVEGPPGLHVLDPVFPVSEKLRLENMNLDLQVWSGVVDITVPFYATGELASETRPLDMPEAEIHVSVRYQACTAEECLLPKTEELVLKLGLDVVDVPALSLHMGHGQREGSYSSMPGMRRLLLRKLRANPFGFLKFFAKAIRLEWAARRRGSQL